MNANKGFFQFALAMAVLLGGAIAGQVARAQDNVPTPSSLPGGKVIAAGDLKGVLDAKGAAVFDTRSAVNYGKGRIPAAQLVAYREKSAKAADFDTSQDQFDLAKLPKDKSAPIVIYSDGPTGWKSYKAAVLAIRGGHKNVMYLRGGLAEWVALGLPVER